MTEESVRTAIEGLVSPEFTVPAIENDGPFKLFRLVSKRGLNVGAVAMPARYLTDLSSEELTAFLQASARAAANSARLEPGARG